MGCAQKCTAACWTDTQAVHRRRGAREEVAMDVSVNVHGLRPPPLSVWRRMWRRGCVRVCPFREFWNLNRVLGAFWLFAHDLVNIFNIWAEIAKSIFQYIQYLGRNPRINIQYIVNIWGRF